VKKAKAETQTLGGTAEALQEEQERQYLLLKDRYRDLYAQYEAKVEALTASETTVQNATAKLDALTRENEKLCGIAGKLQETNKNLQSSVLLAGTQAKEELQKAANDGHRNLEVKIKACVAENNQLRAVVEALKQQHLHAVTNSANHTSAEFYRHNSGIVSQASSLSSPEEELHKAANDEQRNIEAQIKACVAQNTQLSMVVEDLRQRLHAIPRPTNMSQHSEDGRIQTEAELRSVLPSQPARVSPSEERSLYNKFMNRFQHPVGRPAFKDIRPIYKVDDLSSDSHPFVNRVPTGRRSLHCPKRTVWSGGGKCHALVFASTHEYLHPHWVNNTRMVANCGQTFDFFVNQAGFVYYAGIYTVHSLRMVHPPGATVTSDVSRAAILHSVHPHAGSRGNLNECFPDGQIKTECFGLQCVGFDTNLYRALRERFLSAGDKRKAESEELRSDERKNKLQKVHFAMDFNG